MTVTAWPAAMLREEERGCTSCVPEWQSCGSGIISSFSSTKNKNKYGLFGNATSRCMTHLMFLFAPDSQEAFFRELKHRQFQRLQHPHTTDLIVQVLTGPSSLNPFSSDHTCLCIKNVKWLFAYINILSSNCWQFDVQVRAFCVKSFPISYMFGDNFSDIFL